jgi:hypothetical protein
MYRRSLLGAYAKKLLNSALRFILSVLMEQLDFHRMDFSWKLMLDIVTNFCGHTPFYMKWD